MLERNGRKEVVLMLICASKYSIRIVIIFMMVESQHHYLAHLGVLWQLLWTKQPSLIYVTNWHPSIGRCSTFVAVVMAGVLISKRLHLIVYSTKHR